VSAGGVIAATKPTSVRRLHPELPMSVMPHELVRNEGEIMGSRATTKQELQETMDLVAQERIQPIVDRIFPLEDVELAFEALRQGNSLGRNVVAV
jgi:D-arabinose 1-dehydrogenase-like Zn-dependent alcohol dehydrogenase